MTEEFKPYLDAVIKSGDRTRNFIYALVLINFCVLAATLNGIAPNWDDSRLDKLDTALACFRSKRSDKACATALEYANLRGFHFLTESYDDPRNKEVERQLGVRIDHYQQKSVDENSFNIPLFNVPLDVNDLWVLSGLLNCYLMFFLVVCLEREFDDLVLANKHVKGDADKELLLASQLLAKPSKRRKVLIDTLFKFSIIIAPCLFHAVVVYKFVMAYQVLYDLTGPIRTQLILTLCTITLLALFRFSWRAVDKAQQIDRLVADLQPRE